MMFLFEHNFSSLNIFSPYKFIHSFFFSVLIEKLDFENIIVADADGNRLVGVVQVFQFTYQLGCEKRIHPMTFSHDRLFRNITIRLDILGIKHKGMLHFFLGIMSFDKLCDGCFLGRYYHRYPFVLGSRKQPIWWVIFSCF